MKLNIEIPNELAMNIWLSDIADQGSEGCNRSDNVQQLAVATTLMYALAHMMNSNMPESLQQPYLNKQLGTTRMRQVCTECGSSNIKQDAWVMWNIDRQEWELSDIYDNAYCCDCESSCKIEEEATTE